MQIRMGDQVSLAVLTEAFNSGFQDYRYGTTFTPAEMANFLRVSGVAQHDCAVLTDDAGESGLGAALLALDGTEAWCGGLAVAPQQRRHGWATRLMTAIERRAIQQGCTQISLEVLTDNLPAGTLYARLGYRRQRELLLWEHTPEQVHAAEPHHRAPGVLEPADAAQLLAERFGWHTVKPCWQRSAAFLSRLVSNMDGYLLRDALGEPTGYVLMRKYAGLPANAEAEAPRLRILDLAVRPEHNVRAERTHLLHALLRQFPAAHLTLVNEPKESAWTTTLGVTGFQIIERQFEMTRSIG
ncbi:MAG: GNAT family N-acetyltransferase [Caldilineaceae bacterium]|nr:GNAT family N-acetyltransferase [Caldilineaceae bacterium]MCB0141647.1 GNAT family N-acetyltransferase [Caldilineaceae bacterium]